MGRHKKVQSKIQPQNGQQDETTSDCHKCGVSHFTSIRGRTVERTTTRVPSQYRCKLQSCYLGTVLIPCRLASATTISLDAIYNNIFIKIIDARNINYDQNINYSIEQLLAFPSAIIDITSNSLPEQLVERAGIDCMFNLMNYLEFLQLNFNINNINNSNNMIAVINVPNLENAFYTGSYMVFGTGKDYFSPLTCSDVTAHELTHGLVQTTCGLVYQGESGALNESISDCIATSFEFFLYNKYNNDEDKSNDIIGIPDWFIGEDIVKAGKKMLRDMICPNSCNQPQIYLGQFWASTTASYDYGGVHINSGVINHLFYQISQKIGLHEATQLLYRVMKRLGPKSNFRDFANILIAVSYCEHSQQLLECLEMVNLTGN